MLPLTRLLRLAAFGLLMVFTSAAFSQQDWYLANSRKPIQSTTLATAIDAYIYGYPLVLTEYERQFMLAAGTLDAMNQFHHGERLLGPADTAVRRSNNDTLYSSAFLNLKAQPLILHVPDTTGIYYVMQMMDAWTNTFAAPGTRTTGTAEQSFAIVGPDWKGQLPRPITVLRSPTNMVWIIGRTEVNTNVPPEGTCLPIDYTNVHNIQKQYTLTPMSQGIGEKAATLVASRNATAFTSAPTPPDLVEQLTGVQFFQTLSALMRDNPAAEEDRTALKRFEAIGFVPGMPFNPPADMIAEINAAPPQARERMREEFDTTGDVINGWRVITSGIGTYGTDYLMRAAVAQGAIGANLPEDGFYPATSVAIVHGQPVALDSSTKYVIHFNPVPPVNAFWSVTMYDANGYFVENPICRYAIHSTDRGIIGRGAVDILLQPNAPTDTALMGYWLPTPTPPAPFNLILRMYWPSTIALQEMWVPPPVEKQE